MKYTRLVFGLLAAAVCLAVSSGIASAQCSNCGINAINLPKVAFPVYQEQNDYFGSSAFALVYVSAVPSGSGIPLSPNGTNAWCVDDPTTPFQGASNTYVTPYSSLDPTSPFRGGDPVWNKVNYVLNNKQGTFADVQRAIWTLLGKSIPASFTPASPVDANSTVTFADQLVASANANSAFVPGPGQTLGVVLLMDGPAPSGSPQQGVQELLLEVPIPPCGSIGSFVWNDLNKNGIQDNGEPGINGVSLTLTDLSGNAVRNVFGSLVAPASTSNSGGTRPDGSYLFSNLCLGAYKVTVGSVTNMTSTVTGAGTTDTDSNVNPSTTTLTAAAPNDLTIDFGFYTSVIADGCTGSIGDFVWYDANGNGTQDAGEPGLPGLTVTLTFGSTVRTATTKLDGSYQFSGLCGGTYTVSVSNPSTAQTGRPGLQSTPAGGASGDVTKDSNANPFTTVLPANTSDKTIDFGFKGVGGCTLTQGYWKTHSTVWPVSNLYMGGKLYTQAELLAIFNAPVKGDVSIALAYQLIAAKLNLYSGSNVPSSVLSFITQADALLATYTVKVPLKVGSNASMTSLGSSLDSYNNGLVAGTFHCN